MADAISRLTSCDVVTVVTFNGDVDVLGPATKDKFVSSELPKFTAMKPSGGTKLYVDRCVAAWQRVSVCVCAQCVAVCLCAGPSGHVV